MSVGSEREIEPHAVTGLFGVGHTSWLLFKHAVPTPPGPLLSLAGCTALAVAE